MEFPHLLQLIAAQPVRHDLPRALLVLLVARRSAPCSPPRAADLRRRAAADPRRFAADLRLPRRRRRRDTGRARSSAAASDERAAGLDQLETYRRLRRAGARTKRALCRDSSIDAKAAGKSVVGYGAPAKGNTLLNYCGVGADFIDYTVDRSPHKQGHAPARHAHPDLRTRAHRRDATGLRADPAVEPGGRDRLRHGARPRVGRPVRDPHPRGPDRQLTPAEGERAAGQGRGHRPAP